MSAAHYVYIVATRRNGLLDKPVKVGITKNWRSRIKQIQTGSAEKVEYVWIFNLPNKDIAAELEATFHKVQAEHRTSGEWFSIDPLKAIQSMCLNIRANLQVKLSHWDEEDITRAYELTRAQEAWDFTQSVIATSEGGQ